MKLIEKLAEDWWLEQRRLNEKGEGVFESSPTSYEAGFRRAREMASDIHGHCGSAAGCCQKEIDALGEEEIS